MAAPRPMRFQRFGRTRQLCIDSADDLAGVVLRQAADRPEVRQFLADIGAAARGAPRL